MLLSKLVPKRTWYTQIDECVYLGALPMLTYPQELHDMGVKAVINLCQEWNRAATVFTQLGIDHLHLPTVDFHAPSLDSIKKGVEFINQCVKAHKPVYVHCKAGRGRSATVVLCWLLSTQALSAKEAQKILLHKRPHINKHLWRRKVVTAFVERWRGSEEATRINTENISQTY
jgi:atypical dual specificity phosphatase